jgi:hypothetical protein
MNTRSGSVYGSGLNSTASAMLRMATFAPTAVANVSIATAVKPGDRFRL